MTHGEFLDCFDPREYAYWLAYFTLDPWDEQRKDLRAAYSTAMTGWVHGNKNLKVSDFMPYQIKPEEDITTESIFAFVEAING